MDNAYSHGDSHRYNNRDSNKFPDIAESVIKAATARQPVKNAGDYCENGLLYCGKCREKKQKRLEIAGKSIVVCCMCRCEAEEKEQEERQRKQEEDMRYVRQLRGISLMDDKMKAATFSAFTKSNDNQKLYTIARNYVDKFETFYGENVGLIFWGPVGTGKSYTAACIANELLNRKTPVVMTSFVKILQSIQGNDNNETTLINQFGKAKLLIIDDLGAERNTDYAIEKIYNIIDSRYRTKKPLILTTNLTLQQMQETQDVRYQRIYDRVFEMCHAVKVYGKSWRAEQAVERFDTMKKILEE